MDSRSKFIKNLKRIYKIKFYCIIPKLILVTTIVFLTPELIWENIIKKQFFTVFFMIMAEVIFVILTIVLIKSAWKNRSIRNSQIFKCLDYPESIEEIIITSDRILFEIKGMENEILFLKDNTFKKELITNIKAVFGDSKIVAKD